MSAKQLLNGPALLQKIRRISFQIYENNFEEKEIIIAGVIGEGFALAEMLCAHIQEISKLQAKAVEIHLNKEIPYEKPVDMWYL
jgi:pyrimidine operon attenuation protein/uracil phosphoribosyltransferase